MSSRGRNRKPAGKKQTRRKTAAGKSETVTCMHCRYERPAGNGPCPLCGYPWPWIRK
jgi:hypothetical protein